MLKILLTIGFLQLLTMLVLLVRAKVLAVLLGPEWVGVMAVIDKLLALVSQVALFSMPFAAVRFLPQLWKEDPRQFVSLASRMRNVVAAFVAIATIGGWAVSLAAPSVWGVELHPHRAILLVAFLTLPVLALIPFLQNVFAARLEQNTAMKFMLAHAFVLMAASVAGVWWDGLRGMYSLYALAGLALVLLALRRAERLPEGQDGKPEPFSMELPGKIWRFSGALFVLAALVPYAALFVHYQVLSQMGPAAAGWMYAAMAVGIAVRTLLGQGHAIFLTPNVNLGGDPAERIAWAIEYQKVFNFLCVTLVLPVMLFAHLIIRLLFTQEFLPGAEFLALFVLAEVIGLLAGTFQALIVAFHHIGFHVTQNAISQAVMIGLAALLIPEHGILGAAIAVASSYVILLLGSVMFLTRKYALRIPWRTALLSLFVLSALGMAGLAGLWLPELTLTTVISKLGIYAAVLLALALFLTAQDRVNLRRILAEASARVQKGGSGVAS